MHVVTTTEQFERKQRSEKQLRDEGVPILPSLPVVESGPDARIRAESEIEDRALCLLVVALKGEGLEQADLIYRYHWAVTDARVNAKDTPAGLDKGVVYERHCALNWLIGYMEQEWDEITTDT